MGNACSSSREVFTNVDSEFRWDEEDSARGVNITIMSMDQSVKLTVNVNVGVTTQQLTTAIAEFTRSRGQAPGHPWFSLFVHGAEERLGADEELGRLLTDGAVVGSVVLFLLPRALSDPREVLLDLWHSTGGPTHWTNAVNWGTDASLDTWSGVTVADGQVVKLDLVHNNLTGRHSPCASGRVSITSARAC
jgi:hypothetical protein